MHHIAPVSNSIEYKLLKRINVTAKNRNTEVVLFIAYQLFISYVDSRLSEAPLK
jgi:hypothetical protein